MSFPPCSFVKSFCSLWLTTRRGGLTTKDTKVSQRARRKHTRVCRGPMKTLVIFLVTTIGLTFAQVRWPVPPPAPAGTTSEATLIPANESGERLTIEGTVFAPDGHTPVPGVTVYAYNTDAQGYYREDKHVWPPRLHGWV